MKKIGSLGILTLIALAPLCQAQDLPSALRVTLRQPAGVFVKEGPGELSGFDIDMLNGFVAWQRNRSGVEVTLVTETVENIPMLLDRVRAGECDLAVGSITVTAERAETVDFSTPYIPVRMVLFARKDTLPEGPWELAMRGRTAGALAGSTAETRVEELRGEVEDLSYLTYPDYRSLFAALLENSEVDAIVTDVTHFWTLSHTEDLMVLAPMSAEQGLAFVLPQGSPIKPAIDAFLGEFCQSPTYYTLIRKYFGDEAADMVLFSKEESAL